MAEVVAVRVPVTIKSPVSEIKPPAVRLAVPRKVLAANVNVVTADACSAPWMSAPSVKASVSLSVRLRALTTETAPPKLLAASSTMSRPLPAVKVVVPVMFSAPLSWIDPLVPVSVSDRLPPTDVVPTVRVSPAVACKLPVTVPERVTSSASTKVTSRALVMTTLPKSLVAVFRVMSFAVPTESVARPATLRRPVSVMGPLALKFRS